MIQIAHMHYVYVIRKTLYYVYNSLYDEFPLLLYMVVSQQNLFNAFLYILFALHVALVFLLLEINMIFISLSWVVYNNKTHNETHKVYLHLVSKFPLWA